MEDQGMITCFKKYIGFIKSRTNGGKERKKESTKPFPESCDRACLTLRKCAG